MTADAPVEAREEQTETGDAPVEAHGEQTETADASTAPLGLHEPITPGLAAASLTEQVILNKPIAPRPAIAPDCMHSTFNPRNINFCCSLRDSTFRSCCLLVLRQWDHLSLEQASHNNNSRLISQISFSASRAC